MVVVVALLLLFLFKKVNCKKNLAKKIWIQKYLDQKSVEQAGAELGQARPGLDFTSILCIFRFSGFCLLELVCLIEFCRFNWYIWFITFQTFCLVCFIF